MGFHSRPETSPPEPQPPTAPGPAAPSRRLLVTHEALPWAEHRASPRDRMIEIVRRGRRSPEQAEAWAKVHGLPAFAEEPGDELDPLGEIRWTLAMATAWIVWRRPSAVREAWAVFAADCWRWHLVDMTMPRPNGRSVYLGGWEVRQREPDTPSAVLTRAERDDTVHTPAAKAAHELRHALDAGKLAACHGGEVEPIRPERWSRLSPFITALRRGPHDAVYDDQGRLALASVSVERAAVMTLWPAPACETQKQRGRGRRNLQNAYRAKAEDLLSAGFEGDLFVTLKGWAETDLPPSERMRDESLKSRISQWRGRWGK